MTKRTLLSSILLLAFVATPAFAKPKKKEEAPPPPPVAEPAPPPAAEPEAPPEPVDVGPMSPKNVSFSVTLGFADGTSKSGKVTGVERSSDFNGDEGWTTEANKLKFTVEGGGTEKMVPWTDLKGVTITPGKMPDEVDCTYSSDFNPWMYECTLRTNSAATMKDGSKGTITNRHLWRLWFEDGSNVELQVYKHTVRQQDDRELQFGDDAGENFAIYTKLQQQLREEQKTKMLKSVTIQ
jgi:hypothetical protein